jgi:SAM-dependent methyltransferase
MSPELPPTGWLRRDAHIFLVSALILYLELVFIRWIGTELRVLAYLGNLLLVMCFFGVGLGCYLCSRPVDVTRMGVNVLFLVALVANPLRLPQLDLTNVTLMLSVFEDSPLWGEMFGELTRNLPAAVLGGLTILGIVLYLIARIFVPAGQLLGRAIQHHPRLIRAYSVNIAGSLAGIWMFNALTWASTPPPVWFAFAAALMLAAAFPLGRPGRIAAALVAVAALLPAFGSAAGWRTVWSPYHKLAIQPAVLQKDGHRVDFGYRVGVNGMLYFQHMLNLSDEFLAAHPEFFDKESARRSHYNLPFGIRPGIGRLLIVGAGAGNNAAAALRHGVAEVDCVDIDPVVFVLGERMHPERPYDSPRVRRVVNDARAFFKQAVGPYDAIWFGVLDSHTLGSACNSLRLDNYVYTAESLREAARLLADDGVLILSFGSPRPWISDRLYVQMRDAFGHEPLTLYEDETHALYGWGSKLTLISGPRPVTPEDVPDAGLREFVRSRLIELPGVARPATDNWPYLYLERPKIPTLHLVVILTILATVALTARRAFGLSASAMDWHFFALGAAFLLLQVQAVSRAMLLFGMTWVVNAIVISAVLVMILAANLIAARWPRLPRWPAIAGLALTITALAVVPLDWFNMLTGPAKLLAASAFLTGPILFAGLIFIRSFVACTDRARALGSNLIGALAGGLLEVLSFLTGIRALVLLVALFYLLAVTLRPAPAPAPAAPMT